jgi:hypothetical protein
VGTALARERSLQILEDPIILVQSEAHISQELPEKGTNDDLRSVVGNDDDTPVGISKDVVAPLAADPMEACPLRDPSQVPAGDETKPGHAAATSTRHVPTKSENGSCVSMAPKYARIASRMFVSSVGKSGA